MQKLTIFYNPIATAYVEHYLPDPDNATIATSNQLGREEAKSNLKASSEIHDLEEDSQETASGKTV